VESGKGRKKMEREVKEGKEERGMENKRRKRNGE
jgi:hypothetical protein